MTLAEAIAKPVVQLRYTAELVGNVLLRGWLVYSANAYKLASSYTFVLLTFDASSLTLRSSIANVEANDGSYFQAADGTVYVNPPTGQDIYTAAIRGEVHYYFAKGAPTILNNQLYESRLQSVPSLSLRIEPRFSGVGQIGTGSCSLINNDGFFDRIPEIRWRSIQFKLGADTPSSTMAAADYQPFGFWKIQDTRRSGTVYTLNLAEPKAVLENKIPVETFSQADFPNINTNDVGKVIPRVYGKVFGITPICVDAAAKTFKVAGHAVYEFSEVRILQNNIWTAIPFAGENLASGEFTLGAEWANNETVSVDFIGRVNGAGLPMYNASEIVQDILAYLGETNLDTAAFDAAFAALDVGVFDSGLHRTLLKPSLYIGSAMTGLDVISKINAVVGSFLYVDANGQWHYEVFTPKPLDLVDATFSDIEIAENSLSPLEDDRDVYSKVNVKFAERVAEKWAENIEWEDATQQYTAESGSPIFKELTAPLFDADDALYYAQRLISTEALPLRRFELTLPWNGFLLRPGSQIAISSDYRSVYGVLEVLEARHNPDANQMALIFGDRRGWVDSFGWWVGNSSPSWSAALSDADKRTRSEDSGFWEENDDLADPADSKSFRVSRWW